MRTGMLVKCLGNERCLPYPEVAVTEKWSLHVSFDYHINNNITKIVHLHSGRERTSKHKFEPLNYYCRGV